MATVTTNLAELKRLLVEHCDFSTGLFEDDYRLGGRLSVDWAGFAHRPFDARSACVAAFAINHENSHRGVLDRRLLGAPVFFAVGDGHYEVWRPGRDEATRVQESIPVGKIAGFVRQRKAELNRGRLYEAKTLGRLPESDRQLPLFVDPGVLLYAEFELGQQLTSAVVNALQVLARGKKQVTDWAFKATFRLLAAKILKDKRVPGFSSANLLEIDKSLQRVEKHYGARDSLEIGNESQRKRLRDVVSILNRLGDLRNLTTEALADVYEQALITAETRRVHGTHKTPGYLVDYVVWQLADWIAEIPVEHLRIFEPACGHAPFLVSAMRLLRTLDLDVPAGEMSAFLRERLLGIETDAFALEIARLSLTVADEPNPDGWDGLKLGNMLAGDYLEATARASTILLANPPYERGKAQDLLERTLPHLPVGAVFGVVVPATLLLTDKERPRRLREWLTRHCQLGEVSLFPDGIFNFADQECTILLGRRLPDGAPTRSMRTRLRRVREPDREGFQQDYRFTTSRLRPQSILAEQPENELWIPEFDEEIWAWLAHLPKLESIAAVNQGMQYKGAESRPKNSRTVEDKPFPRGVEGFDRLNGNWFLHEHPRVRYFSTDEAVIRRPGSGLDRVDQVLVNHSPMGRGKWRLKPFIDRSSRVFASSLISVRPLVTNLPLEYLWALCASPIAQFYAYCFMLKRNIHTGILGKLPIPASGKTDILRVSKRAEQYLLAGGRQKTLLEQGGFSQSKLLALLLGLDAEVLRLYDLPADAERLLLDQFAGEQRPGIPFRFTSYPTDFTAGVPLYAYLSGTFQRFLRGESPRLPDDTEQRHDALVARSDAGHLTSTEVEELHRLQAEVDGFDYALQAAQATGSRELEDRRRARGAKLKRLDDRLASASLREADDRLASATLREARDSL
jgi:hypothetical protein